MRYSSKELSLSKSSCSHQVPPLSMMPRALNVIAIKILNKIKGRIEVIYCTCLASLTRWFTSSACAGTTPRVLRHALGGYTLLSYIASELVHIVTNLLGAVRSYSLRRQISPRIHLPLYSMYSNLHGRY